MKKIQRNLVFGAAVLILLAVTTFILAFGQDATESVGRSFLFLEFYFTFNLTPFLSKVELSLFLNNILGYWNLEWDEAKCNVVESRIVEVASSGHRALFRV